jgi:hypothetical protein
LYVNGTAVTSANALAPFASMDSINMEYFNSTQSFGQKAFALAVWKTALTNDQLTALTTL